MLIAGDIRGNNLFTESSHDRDRFFLFLRRLVAGLRVALTSFLLLTTSPASWWKSEVARGSQELEVSGCSIVIELSFSETRLGVKSQSGELAIALQLLDECLDSFPRGRLPAHSELGKSAIADCFIVRCKGCICCLNLLPELLVFVLQFQNAL